MNIEITPIFYVDAVLAVLFTCLLALIIFNKSGLKVGMLYLGVLLLFLTVEALDVLFSMPILLSVVRLITILFMLGYVLININELKTVLSSLSKLGQGLKKEDIKASDEDLRVATEEIVKACTSMSKVRAGALIVIAPGNISPHLLETGTEMGALVSAPLLESIFVTKGPCHDGAVIVKGNRILAAGCFLPLSQSPTLAKNLGTRHRAGIGITEQTDMLTIIVSEENGIISVAQNGVLRRYITPERLSDIIKELYGINTSGIKSGIKK